MLRARKTMYTFALNFTTLILIARTSAKEVQVERSCSSIHFQKGIRAYSEANHCHPIIS
jgi:hypothetical protein